MAARVPLDVDLEDRLVFGLTPQRFGYLVLAALAVLALWGQHWIWFPIRLFLCLPPALTGAALALGRWRGRPLDELFYDCALYLWANYTVTVTLPHRHSRSEDRAKSEPNLGSLHDGLLICSSPGLDHPPWNG